MEQTLQPVMHLFMLRGKYAQLVYVRDQKLRALHAPARFEGALVKPSLTTEEFDSP